MFRLIKIVFNACFLVLAIIGFNAIGGQKYVESAKNAIVNFVQERAMENAKKVGDFSGIHEEFQIDNTVSLLGYKAVIAEHDASGQKMCIIDSGTKALLTQADIQGPNLEKKLNELVDKFKHQSISFQEIKITSRGNIDIYGKTAPYAKFEAKSNKLPFSDISGIVSSVKTSDGSEKIAISINERKRYSQLISEEFFKDVKEN